MSTIQRPQYRRYEKVEALRIRDIKTRLMGSQVFTATFIFDEPHEPQMVMGAFLDKYRPKVDGFVVWKDYDVFYMSAEEFESQYE